ncbi:MAG: class I SAM-dependent methyltransferase [Planctomycetes bacterium]|nr:class I SAM-dependent methyltransferase [Planctomycetota bacterium]
MTFWQDAVTEEQTRSEADFIQSSLALPAGSRVLDVPCGNGRHTVELAARGYRPTGVDIADWCMGAARSKARERGVQVDWLQGNMAELPWREEFDGAYCFGNSFGYLDDEGNAQFLKAVARALKPGARFILDTGILAESLFAHLVERAWYPAGDAIFLAERRYHLEAGRLESEYTILRQGKLERKTAWYRNYTYRELIGLLRAAGFSVEGSSGSLEKEPFRLGSPRLLLVAARK